MAANLLPGSHHMIFMPDPARCLDNSSAACLLRQKRQDQPNFLSVSNLNEHVPCKPSTLRTGIVQPPPQGRLP